MLVALVSSGAGATLPSGFFGPRRRCCRTALSRRHAASRAGVLPHEGGPTSAVHRMRGSAQPGAGMTERCATRLPAAVSSDSAT